MGGGRSLIFAVVVCLSASLYGQTTQGLISGRLLNSVTGRPVPGATISYFDSTGPTGSAPSDQDGYYYLLSLSPGTYRVQVSAAGFQSQEVEELELRVASRIDLDFRLRPLSDVWESGQYNSVFLPGSKTVVTFFGPDVDPSRSGTFEATQGKSGTLEASVSEVIDSPEISDLPLYGRDVYTMLVTLPGITSDAALARGLGLSVNGQRPSSSNFLLDGVENNNYLTTGPLTTVAPEAIQEYRVSISNYSAEYGRASGFIANAVTRAGSSEFHGQGYFYLMNDVLNANGFQENLNGFRRAPDKQVQPGFVIGGPVLKHRLYFSTAYEYFRSRTFEDPQSYTLPSPELLGFAIPGSVGAQLLQQYAPPLVPGPALANTATFSPPVAFDRTLGIQRFDYSPAGGKDKWMARLMGSFVNEPDFIWTPYPAFVSALHENTGAAAVTGTHSFRANLMNEVRASFSADDLHWNRPHSEVPTLLVENGGVTLPGSPAFYGYRNVNPTGEFLDDITWAHNRHLVKAGAGLLLRGSDGYLTAGQDGEYEFLNAASFVRDSPLAVSGGINRASLPNIEAPDYNRSYRYRQYYGFVQDTYRITARLTANYGLRYELFGAPQNVGSAKDSVLALGPGGTLSQQLMGAALNSGIAGNQTLFGTDKNDWGVRLGAAYDIFGNAQTVLRGGFGTFYDRPFDNLWENLRVNGIAVPFLTLPGTPMNFLAPVTTVLAGIKNQSVVNSNTFPDLTLIDPNLKNGQAKSYFVGMEHRFSAQLSLDVNGLGSYGSRLITTDIINRAFSTTGTVSGRYNSTLPDILYRAGQGVSSYNALATVLRYRTSRSILQATYTWSHAIDNQSDPLIGDFFNLAFSNQLSGPSSSGARATFSEQFNPNADRGNADFDQRQNLVVLGYWNLPEPFAESKVGVLTRGWSISALAAFRSGLPYSVFGSITDIPGQGYVENNRANLLNASQAFLARPVPVEGGQLLLNAGAFANAGPSILGNTGRNAFTGPGFYSLDLSLGKSFRLPVLGDAGRLLFRADGFNMLNHANLNNPVTQLNDPNFGIALYGRQGAQSGFPAVTPLNEAPRQVQLSLKVTF